MASIFLNKKSIETNNFIFQDTRSKNYKIVDKIKTSTVEFFHSIQKHIQQLKSSEDNNNSNSNTNSIPISKSEENINNYIYNHFNPPPSPQRKKNILFIFQNLINNSTPSSTSSTPNHSPRSPNQSPRSPNQSPNSSPRTSNSTPNTKNTTSFDITFNMVVEKERVILTVKVPEVGLTKKILFDKVETIKDAILLVIEKLPPGCLDASEYNLFLPQKNQWCKIDSRFSKYQFKENQEIEFKKDSRGGVTHMINSVSNLLTRPYRTIYIKLPEIVTVGTLPPIQSNGQVGDLPSSLNYNPTNNSTGNSGLSKSTSKENLLSFQQQSQSATNSSSNSPVIHRRRTSSFSYDPNIHHSSLTNSGTTTASSNTAPSPSLTSGLSNSNSSTSISSDVSSSSGNMKKPSFSIPKLNLTDTNLNTSTTSSPRGNGENASMPPPSTLSTSSPRPPLEHKKSFLKIIGLSPRGERNNSSSQSAPNSLNNSSSSILKTSGGMTNYDSAPTTPRNFGTFVKQNSSSNINNQHNNQDGSIIEAYDFEDDSTLGEVLNKIYQKYQFIEKDLLEDYSLITKDGIWLVDRNKTIAELGLKHMEEVEFKRMTQKVKVVFLNRELVLNFNPSDSLKEINYKIIVHYLPSLIKLTRSNSILNSSTQPQLPSSSPLNVSSSSVFRSSLSIEPLIISDLENSQILSNTPPPTFIGNHQILNIQSSNSINKQRSYSDASPLSFSKDYTSEISNHQQQNIEQHINRRKNSISTNPLTGSKDKEYITAGSSDTIQSNSSTGSSNIAFSLQQNRYPIPDNLIEFKDFKLHLSGSRNQNPNINQKFDMLLDERRTLSSFNFWNNIKLHFKNSTKSLHSDSKRVAPILPFYLQIEAISENNQSLSISHILELECTLSISDIIKSFNRLLLSNDSIKINDSLDEYGLYFDTINNSQNTTHRDHQSVNALSYGSSIYLDPHKTLSHYPMVEPLDKLIFKRTNSIFGVDPNTIPTRLDPITGFQIPCLLLDLKLKFIQLDGFSIESIFKTNNYHDPTFSDIIKAIESDTILSSSIDAIGIACFIKRWFMKLPKKICSLLDDETLLYASTQESTAESSLNSIPQPYRSLLLWLVRFLSEVAQSAYTNKCSAKILAIVIAPNLISISPNHNNNNGGDNNTPTSSTVGKYTSLEKLHQCTLFLRNLIKLKLRDNGFLPISTSSISISNSHNSSSFISMNSVTSDTSISIHSSNSPISSSISRSPSFDTEADSITNNNNGNNIRSTSIIS